MEVISATEIAESGAKSTVELLEKRANLFIRKLNANPTQCELSMRGFGENSFSRVKVIVDGEELNNLDMARQDFGRIPLSAVKEVEIFHGPQTVLFGGNASSGVINIITDDETVRKEVEVKGGSFGNVGLHFGSRGTLLEEPLYYFADFDFERADGYRQNGWHELWNVKAGLKRKFDNGSKIGFKAYYSNTQYGLPGGVYHRSYGYGAWYDGPFRDALDPYSHARNDVVGLTFNSLIAFNDENTLSLDAGYKYRHSFSYFYLDTIANELFAKLKFSNIAELWGLKNKFNLGADFKLDFLNTNENRYSRFTPEAYVYDELNLMDTLSFVGGVRSGAFLVRNEYEGDKARKTRGVFAGEFGLNWQPHEASKLFVRASRYYHAPLADEMISTYGVPNLNLKPEYGWNFEAGVDFALYQYLNFNFTAFYTIIDDEIAYYRYANCNLPFRTARTGFETALKWSREYKETLGIAYNLTSAKFIEGEYDGNVVPLVPLQQLRLFGEYYLFSELSIGAGFRFVGAQYYGSDFANVGGKLPAYTLVDLNIKYAPFWLNGLTLTFTCDNLLDRRYVDYGQFFGGYYVYPAAGRSFNLAIRYEF